MLFFSELKVGMCTIQVVLLMTQALGFYVKDEKKGKKLRLLLCGCRVTFIVTLVSQAIELILAAEGCIYWLNNIRVIVQIKAMIVYNL